MTIDAHYALMPIQPMAYSMANGLDAQQHTVIKYVSRYKTKGQRLRDLLAARKVLDQMIEQEQGGDPYGLKAYVDAAHRPGHTDLMVSPEDIGRLCVGAEDFPV